MISTQKYISSSLELHLFFLRIMMEHSLFLEGGFTPKNRNLAVQADQFKEQFANLLAEAVTLAHGNIRMEVVNSGEIVTPFTLRAEEATSFFTSIPISTKITQQETSLVGNSNQNNNAQLEDMVCSLNQRAISLTNDLIKFKTNLLKDVLACRLFTFNYPLLIEHIRREAQLFVRMLTMLQRGQEIQTDLIEQQIFWNKIMAEHSKFIRGLLDPTEEQLFTVANNFGQEFDLLTKKAKAAMGNPNQIVLVTKKSLEATREIQNFKEQGTKGILNCNITSIILPLLADHVLREANHYLRLLRTLSMCDN
ncbi:MAG: DUF2935 domain-containing protein [Bacillota bacterium]|nr:DUF2935 domain-containing protein [Bacillota bacterium]